MWILIDILLKNNVCEKLNFDKISSAISLQNIYRQ